MMTETVVGKAKISKAWQIALIREVRPFLNAKPGDKIEYIVENGKVYVRKAQAKS